MSVGSSSGISDIIVVVSVSVGGEGSGGVTNTRVRGSNRCGKRSSGSEGSRSVGGSVIKSGVIVVVGVGVDICGGGCRSGGNRNSRSDSRGSGGDISISSIGSEERVYIWRKRGRKRGRLILPHN